MYFNSSKLVAFSCETTFSKAVFELTLDLNSMFLPDFLFYLHSESQSCFEHFKVFFKPEAE